MTHTEGEQSALKRDAAAGKLVLPKDGRFDVSIRFEDGHAADVDYTDYH